MSPDLAVLAGQGLALLKAHVKGFTRKDGAFVAEHDDKRAAAQPGAAGAGKPPAAAKPAAVPGIGAHADALRSSSKEGGMDHWSNQAAAAHMSGGDTQALKNHLAGSDTAERDHILDHIHPDHWEGLGFKPLNKDKSVKEHEAKFGAKPGAGDIKPVNHPKGHKPGSSVMFPHPDKPGKKALGKYVGQRNGKSVISHDKLGEQEVDNDKVSHAAGVPKQADPEATKEAGAWLRAQKGKAPMTKALLFTAPARLQTLMGLAKAHVKGFTRKDGAFVAEHDTKAAAGAPTKPAAPKFGVHHSELKEGDTLYDEKGQNVDEVESFGRAMRASDRMVNTRAGYSHATQGGYLHGLSNKKPGAAAPAKDNAQKHAELHKKATSAAARGRSASEIAGHRPTFENHTEASRVLGSAAKMAGKLAANLQNDNDLGDPEDMEHYKKVQTAYSAKAAHHQKAADALGKPKGAEA